ncbi:MAG: bifunctional nuclease family protein [Candidatus Saganbacteria bacterium]|nr:bifunctional nuclease family protein [Candidatus Saganbacteria bacterium]
MIQMQIGGLGFDPRNLSPIVLLRDEEEMNFLPIWIGIFEAAAIAMELQGVQPPRPMTHDLLKTAIEKFEGKVLKVVINDVKEGTFYAVIEIEGKDGKKLSIDARPSDAIALAVRTKAPIENMKPVDFTKYFK